MTAPDRTVPDSAPAEARPGLGAPAPVPSGALMGGARKLLIEHAGEIYTLQITRQNRLLLTK